MPTEEAFSEWYERASSQLAGMLDIVEAISSALEGGVETISREELMEAVEETDVKQFAYDLAYLRSMGLLALADGRNVIQPVQNEESPINWAEFEIQVQSRPEGKRFDA